MSRALRRDLLVAARTASTRTAPTTTPIELAGAPTARARAGLVRYVFLAATRRSVWMEAAPLAELLALTPWRRDLVVGPLWQFLSGERVLRIAGYRDGVPRTTWETAFEESLASE